MIEKIPKPIGKRWLCHIDITNHCEAKFGCSYCTRYIRHLRPDQKYFMPLDYFETVLESLKYYPTQIGIMGGLPTKHPQFNEICEILQSKFPKEKLLVWTSGEPEYAKFKPIIEKTFGGMSYNEHNEEQKELCEHQVTTLALNEVIDDKELQDELISNCWVLDYWCPTIGYRPDYKGAFVCELMLGLDIILGANKGIDFVADPFWWNRPVNDPEYLEQLNTYCQYCSMCLPSEKQLLKDKVEKISPKFSEILKNNGSKFINDKYTEIVNKIITRDDINKIGTWRNGWNPEKNRGDLPGGEP